MSIKNSKDTIGNRTRNLTVVLTDVSGAQFVIAVYTVDFIYFICIILFRLLKQFSAILIKKI